MITFDNYLESKAVGLLIDPDKVFINEDWIMVINAAQPNFILVGGSQSFSKEKLEHTILTLKNQTQIPVLGFPGDISQVHSSLDALLALSVIQSTTNRFIFQPILGVIDFIDVNNIQTFYTPYLIVQNTGNTSVEKVLGDNLKTIIDEETFIQYLKVLKLLKPSCIYVEAGSGAHRSVNVDWIMNSRTILKNTYWFVGGGIRTTNQAVKLWRAGADCVVVGNGVEDNLEFLLEICEARNSINTELNKPN